MPIENKSIWENCANVLLNKSDEELQLYFIELFEWLKDMNWPGAYLIYDRLICVSTEYFLSAYQYSRSVAKQMRDHTWEMVLNDLFIEYVYNLLDCNRPSEIQAIGINLAKNIETITPFMQPLTPKYNKNIWENCAAIVAKESDEKLKPYLVKLLEWLQDMNWPGAYCIQERMQRYTDNNSIHSAIDICVKKAKDCNDVTWERNLYMLMQKHH